MLKYSFLLLIPLALYGTEFSVLTYNVLWYFPIDSFDVSRTACIADAVSAAAPDIIVLQEIWSNEASDSLLSAFRAFNPAYQRAAFVNGPGTDNMLIYDGSFISLLSQQQIHTDYRDITEYLIQIGGVELRIYGAHLAAGSGVTYEAQRDTEAAVLRNYLNALPAGTEFIICGDMNLYGSYESAYQRLVENEAINIGRAIDPMDTAGYWQAQPDSGNWHANARFASMHTQSTRTRSFGGGATGGLDDRFDFILLSFGMNNGSGIEYIAGSYAAFGNDGMHLNDSINDPPNTAVGQVIANALHYASDHLPVRANFDAVPLSIGANAALELSQIVIAAVPNPFNSSCAITIDMVDGNSHPAAIEICDLRGKCVWKTTYYPDGSGQFASANQLGMSLCTAGVRGVIWQPDKSVSSGVYLLSVRTGDGQMARGKIVCLK